MIQNFLFFAEIRKFYKFRKFLKFNESVVDVDESETKRRLKFLKFNESLVIADESQAGRHSFWRALKADPGTLCGSEL